MYNIFFAQNIQGESIEGLEYGRLYNWAAVTYANFGVLDFEVPTITDWQTLNTYLTYNGYSTKEGGALKETGLTHWISPNSWAVDAFGFAARGGGSRSSLGVFEDLKTLGTFWSKSNYDTARAYSVRLTNSGGLIYESTSFKTQGASVRLIYKGTEIPGETIPDSISVSGVVYNIIKIGTQYWLDRNWHAVLNGDSTPIPNVTDNAAWAALATGAYCNYNNDITLV